MEIDTAERMFRGVCLKDENQMQTALCVQVMQIMKKKLVYDSELTHMIIQAHIERIPLYSTCMNSSICAASLLKLIDILGDSIWYLALICVFLMVMFTFVWWHKKESMFSNMFYRFKMDSMTLPLRNDDSNKSEKIE
jgi:hypothetical protein